jgi:integrase
MRLYRGTYKDRDGTKQKSDKWYAEIRVNDRPRRVALFTDKTASREFAERLESYQLYRAGDLTDRLREWLQSITTTLAATLIDMGLIDARHVTTAKPLLDHVADYETYLRAKDRNPRHIEGTIAQIKKIAAECGFRYWADVVDERLETYLGELHDGGRGLKARSVNGYLVAFKAFVKWAVDKRRIASSPISSVDKLAMDDASERRALTLDEMRVLIAQTELEPERFTMTGPERAMLYRLAVETGLRAGELQSLTRGSFQLDGKSPAVTILARNAKNKKTESLYLSAELAELLRPHLARKFKGVPAFSVPDHTHTAEMFRADYTAARNTWIAAAPAGAERDARERSSFLAETDDLDRPLVFHCLRHTCGVWAFEYKRMMPREVQSLMRVSSLALVDRYTRSFNVDGKDRANLIPSMSTPAASPAIVRTGTSG